MNTHKLSIIETHWAETRCTRTRKIRRIKRRVTREGIGCPACRSRRKKR